MNELAIGFPLGGSAMIVPAPSQQHQLISKGASKTDNCLNSLFSASKRKARDYKSVEYLVAVQTE